MNRREFLRSAGGAVLAGQMLSARAWAASRPAGASGQLPRRPYGKDKVMLSIIGFPGFALTGVPQEQVSQVVSAAIDRGCNYFDIAPTYGDAEQRLGPALEPYRKNVFLACKTGERTRDGAKAKLDASLKHLRTDHFDLYQLHHIQHMDKDIDVAFGKGGAMEVLIEAKKAGIVKYLGFSAHSIEAALAAMDRYDFDSALFPINYASWHTGHFGEQILKAAREKGVTCLALKGMARQQWPEGDPAKKKFHRCWYQPITDRREASLSLRWTLSQPITAAIPPADVSLLPLALDIGASFKPIQPDETQALAALASEWKPVFKRA